jgi:hypothetical protein
MRENFSELRSRLCEYASIYCPDTADSASVEELDAELQVTDMTLPTASAIADLSPFGESNRVPLFLFSNAEIESMTALSGGKHTRLILKKDDIRISGVLFGAGPHLCKAQVGDIVDVIVNLEINEYGYSRSVQLMVKKMFLSGREADLERSSKTLYQDVMSGQCEMDDFPVRSDFAAVYRFLTHSTANGISEMSYRYAAVNCPSVNYAKLRLILDIFMQTGLIRYKDNPMLDTFRFSIEDVKEKVNIENAALYRRLCPTEGD